MIRRTRRLFKNGGTAVDGRRTRRGISGSPPPGFSCESRLLRPLLRCRLRPLMGKQPGAPRLLLWRDRRRVFAILGAGRHRLFYRRPLADLIKPALDVGKFVEVDIAALQGYCPRI